MEFQPAANKNELLKNVVLPFALEESGIRGRFVRLNEEAHNILSKHKYPVKTSKMLGELLVLVTMIGSMLKLRGMVSIQVQGDGAVSFLSADYRANGDLRGYVNIADRAALKKVNAGENISLLDVMGKGHIVITIENENERPYQAIVPLEGKSLTECITNYFHSSDQMTVAIEVASGQINKKWHAGGILLQHVPDEGGKKRKQTREREEEWNTANILLQSVTEKELIDDKLEPNTLLFRLFHEDGVRVFEPQKLQAKCRCSRQRMQNSLIGLSRDDIKSIQVKGVISIKCHFCNRKEDFSEEDLI